jgi:hypothetical protein
MIKFRENRYFRGDTKAAGPDMRHWFSDGIPFVYSVCFVVTIDCINPA